jgi:methyl-accepting chemotaxis protein
MAFNPWAKFGSQRTLWVVLAVALGVLLLTIEVAVSLWWVRGRVPAADAAQFRGLLLTVAAATEAFAIAVVLWATTSITQPLRQAVSVLDRVAAGDLTARLDIANRDELGRMARALNHTSAALADALRSVGVDANALAAAARDMGDVSRRLAENAQATSAQADGAEQATTSVTESTRSAAAGMTGINAAIRDVAANVAEASRVTDGAMRAAATANQMVARLDDSSMRIGNVVKMITAIAEQTNLLALNATIEAARAGDAGKGFAVVASEVKDLAQETAQATNEIAQRVQVIQKDTTEAINVITEIGSVIAQINGYQSTVAAALEAQTSTASDVSRSVSEAATHTADIGRGLNALSGSARDTRDMTSAVRRSSDDLGRMAARLAEVAARYRIASDP